VSTLIIVSIFSALNGLVLTTPRMYYAMARDGLFFQKLTSVHPRFGTPVFSILALTAWGAALGPDGVAASDRVAAEAVSRVAGSGAGRLIAAAILVSIFSAANGLTISAPRVYYAMARDGLFFRRLAAVHPRYGTPAASIVAGTAWSMVLAVSGTFEQLLTYVVFVGWIFYGLGAACVFILRRTRPDASRPFRVPGYPWTPLLFIVAAAALVANTIATQPVRAAIGIGVVLLGLPVYFVWRTRSGAL
jgi:APA family basic amino acid/polyamine antiporter